MRNEPGAPPAGGFVPLCGPYADGRRVSMDAAPDCGEGAPARGAVLSRERGGRRGGVRPDRRTGRRVKAIIPVHILGHPVDMQPLMELSSEFNLAVIEDATES